MENYENTDWGKFYSNYKQMTQGQLQKGLQKFLKQREDYRTKSIEKDGVAMCRQIFYKTKRCEDDIYITPRELFKDTNYHNGPEWLSALHKQKKAAETLLIDYITRQTYEFNEVSDFYEKRKEEAAVLDKERRKAKSKEQVVCPYCNACVTRTNMSKHQKTIKCLAKQQITIL